MATASDQLARLLSLVPWLRAHPGVSKGEAAAAFGISVDQLERDLQLAFTCELPGQPEVFIDIDYLDSDRVSVIDAGSIDRPLRLRADEAVSLLVGLRSLAAVPGLADRAALDSALAKIEDAAARIGVGLGPDTTALRGSATVGDADPMAAIRQGLAEARRLHLGYWVPSRDEVTERDVDPFRVFSVDDTGYLEGYCHASEDVRTFRLDRVMHAEVLPQAATAPQAPPDRVREPAAVFHPSDEDTVVVLDLGPEARWVPEYYSCEWVQPAPDGPEGSLRVALRTADPRLVVRLVLRLGGAARVVEPADVAADVREAAGEALAAYGVSSATD